MTFQDHPYQPAFLDTWMLLTWVAAGTERVKVSGNVLNLPLRPPAVLARAAAADVNSGVAFVRFYVDAALLGTVTSSPRQANWNAKRFFRASM